MDNEINLKVLREQRGLSQKEFAALLNVSPGCLSKYENGRCKIPTDILIRIADVFDISVDYLLGRSCFSFSYSLLNQYYIGKTKNSQLINDALSLSKRDRTVIYEVISALKYRSK